MLDGKRQNFRSGGFTLIEVIMTSSMFVLIIIGVFFLYQNIQDNLQKEKIKADFKLFSFALKNSLTRNCKQTLMGSEYDDELPSVSTVAKGMIPENLKEGDELFGFIINSLKVSLTPGQSVPNFNNSPDLTRTADFIVEAQIAKKNLTPFVMIGRIPLLVASIGGSDNILFDCAPSGTYAAECLINLFPQSSECGDPKFLEEMEFLKTSLVPNQICIGTGGALSQGTGAGQFCDIDDPKNIEGYRDLQDYMEEFFGAP